MKDDPYRIAVLSATGDAFAIVARALSGAGHTAKLKQVADDDAFCRSLEGDALDLIILNHRRYDGSIRSVIRQRNLYHPEIPVIVVCNYVDAQVMEEAIYAGASDLVALRDELRLQSVVSRELRTLGMERALSSTIVRANEYRRQFEGHSEPEGRPIAYSRGGIIVDANDAWRTLFQIADKKHLIGTSILVQFADASRTALQGALSAVVDGKWPQDEFLRVTAAGGDSPSRELTLSFRLAMCDGQPAIQIGVNDGRAETGADAISSVLQNRKELVHRLKKRLLEKPRSGLKVLLYVKPDDFDGIRKAVGGLNTDEVIAQFSDEVTKLLQPNDVAGLFEEAVIIALLERGSERDAAQWAQELVERIRRTVFKAGNHTITFTSTIGMCTVSGSSPQLDELLNAADDAHERGWQDGGNCVVMDETSEAKARVREYDEVWIGNIRTAFSENRFRLVQLPIVSLHGDKPRMFDILIRMLDRKDKEILPSEFLPSAQRHGLMSAIDRWVIKAAMDHGEDDGVDRLFVKLSTESVLDPALPAWLGDYATRQGLSPRTLCFQIPADDANRYIKQTERLSTKMRRLGFRFALEHFRCGQHQQSLLDILQPSYVKIDGEQVQRLPSDTQTQSSVQHVVRLASLSGIETVAERVESASVMAVLFKLGVRYMQGHYVQEPEIVLQQSAIA